jgi:hypothetical protein
MLAILMMGHYYIAQNADASYYWTPFKREAYRFQDGTSARSYRDAKRLPMHVSVVDERGFAL